MNSITPLPNDFIKKHCKPNFDKTPEYGIRTMPVSYMTTDFLKDEINNLKENNQFLRISRKNLIKDNQKQYEELVRYRDLYNKINHKYTNILRSIDKKKI